MLVWCHAGSPVAAYSPLRTGGITQRSSSGGSRSQGLPIVAMLARRIYCGARQRIGPAFDLTHLRTGLMAVVTAHDISWSGPGGTFNLRVAAIIARGDQVLLCTVDGLGYWFLPGGRARLGESGQEALARELAEELRHDLPAGKVALVVENIYHGSTLQHEIGLYYLLAWPSLLAPEDLQGGIEPGHRFCWMPVRELRSVRFEPAGLIPVLCDLGDAIQHVVLDSTER